MQKPNRLINELSPYLLQHAYNPVDWYPWGDEAFQRAKKENKPIFLSIGYSTCHWCHVMEKESFEDRHIAELLNTYFVPVKVDREERPDVDELYMKAVMVMTGHGGWPLTVFLTPDLRPFFGGTYFPPRRKGGLRGLDEILKAIADLWQKNPDDIKRAADQTTSVLKTLYISGRNDKEPSYNVVVQCFDSLVASYDELYGGFGAAPKFPMPTYIEFLHAYYVVEGEPLALKMSANTLEKMARGGIYDQLGGGFFRYSTDRIWLIPHFEKMLYDNTMLARVYLQAYQLSGKVFFKEIAVSTLEWMLDELGGEKGGFYSAVDADSPDGEGAYYTWTKKEVEDALGKELSEIALKAYGISEAGNFEHGKSVLTFPKDVETLSQELSVDKEDLTTRFVEIKRRLLEARAGKARPAVDDKIIASWNGLAISTYSLAYQVLNEQKYINAAVKTADYILSNLWKNGKMYRFFARNSVGVEGFLEDYAYVANGLLDLFQTCFEPKYLKAAVELTEKMIESFWDGDKGGFFYSHEEVADISRIKEAYDGVLPSGNSMAAWVLIRLYELTSRGDLLEKAAQTFKAFYEQLDNHPMEHVFMSQALAAYIKPRIEIVVASNNKEEAKQLLSIVHNSYHPFKTVIAVGDWNREELEEISPLVKDKASVKGKPTAYICENYTCRMPVTEPEELKKILGWKW